MAATRKSLPNKPVVAAVADALARHVPPHARLVLGLSGGLDSVALLHVLRSLRDQHPFELRVVHVHHGLSPHADDWADFCARLCASHGLESSIHRVEIARNDAAGIEAAARRERQRIFAAIDADFLLTAHQQDDQAETLLLQLLRGAGPKGLAAITELQSRSDGAQHNSAAAGVTRAGLLDYAVARLDWVDDESNQDVRYRRNALRRQVMPLWLRISGNIATARAAALQACAELLDDLARLDAETAIAGDRLDCTALAGLSLARARNLLRYFIEQRGQPMPNARQLNEALHQLRDAGRDARVCVRLGTVELWRFRGGAYLVPLAPIPAAPVRWQGEASLWVAAAGVSVRMEAVTGAGLKRDVLTAGEVTLGVRQGGERLRLHAGGPHRSLKNLLQEHAIPPWQRDRLPLLWCNGRLAWAAGIGLEADLLATSGDPGVLPRVAD
jgi:tRNA(Ile)-lysidine synthase